MDQETLRYTLWAIGLGALSALSMPLGSIVGLKTNPRPAVMGMMAAFGAGALIAALSVELVAPTVEKVVESRDAIDEFVALIVGAIAGGLVFVTFDTLLNAKGGFLRRMSTTLTHFRRINSKQRQEFVHRLSQFEVLRGIPAEHIDTLVSLLRPQPFADGEALAEQGDPVNTLMFVLEGRVAASRDGKAVAEAGPGNLLGSACFLTDAPSPGTATAKGEVLIQHLDRQGYETLCKLCPEFERACGKLAGERLELVMKLVGEKHGQAQHWAKQAAQSLKTGAELPTTAQLRQAKQEHHGAPLAIWLGMVIDGIPESLVIGAGMFGAILGRNAAGEGFGFVDVIPFTFIAGLFLSNFPEALSSSANMKRQGWKAGRILWLWISLLLITALFAGVGYLVADSLDPTWLVFAEGMAAGAMLTMITAAMIPEAVMMCRGNAVGLSTLAGFLAAVSFKLLE